MGFHHLPHLDKVKKETRLFTSRFSPATPLFNSKVPGGKKADEPRRQIRDQQVAETKQPWRTHSAIAVQHIPYPPGGSPRGSRFHRPRQDRILPTHPRLKAVNSLFPSQDSAPGGLYPQANPDTDNLASPRPWSRTRGTVHLRFAYFFVKRWRATAISSSRVVDTSSPTREKKLPPYNTE